jgi:hypothetical protein
VPTPYIAQPLGPADKHNDDDDNDNNNNNNNNHCNQINAYTMAQKPDWARASSS